MRDYRKIKAWELADDFAVATYRITAAFPPEEKYALTSQLRRASYSIAANIAEGAGRRTTKDFVRFLDMALGSSNEAEYFCHLAHRLKYIEDNVFHMLKKEVASVGKCLASYIRAVEKDIANS